MLKKTIQYTDFNDQSQSKEFYFNMNTKEVFDMLGVEENPDGDLTAALVKAGESRNITVIMGKVSDIILDAYGERSADGQEFVKTPELRERFSRTAAFDALLDEVSTDESALSNFVIAIMPKKMSDQLVKVMSEQQAANG